LGTLSCEFHIRQDALIDELKHAVASVLRTGHQKYRAAINRHASQIMACVICAMQHIPLRFSNNREAYLRWWVDPKDGCLGLCAAFTLRGIGIRVPHVSSEYVVPAQQQRISELACLEMVREADALVLRELRRGVS
jgi:hypothetical protein